ncbi:hypothetical protein NC653_036006 [Populus alba x Populus x berolinensis]|uniref:Uncharacterized protein n=1 Tax=Populus alba x Populus x berolinensis TaxID=444605 RepID=A0AAD6PUE5_9ROSI|nr:hypothetical protein NC653_036006 [Populus alba x Populus x berolinensis]
MPETDLSEIRVDPLINKEEGIHNNQPQELKMDETLGNYPLKKDERSSWFSSIMEREDKDTKNNQPLGPKIPKVADKLRNENKECYSPSMVSIGPYHSPGPHDNDREKEVLEFSSHHKNLKEAEILKFSMARQFIRDSGKGIELMFSEVEKGIQNAREFYNEIDLEGYDDEQFTRMMFLDGCFILQFIHCVTHNYENLEKTDRQVASCWCEVGFVITGEPDPFSSPEITDESEPDKDPAHLLQLLYFLFVGSHYIKGKSSSRRCCHCLSYLATCLKKFIPTKCKPVARGRCGHYLYYSAKELKKVGIHFMSSQTSALTDVKFKSSSLYGTLNLPSITIDESTKSMFLNLVAFETSVALNPLWVTSYICFMDSLIDDADDVKELRSKGIIINFHGADQQVADLFNHMGRFLEPDTSVYNDVKKEINEQCKSIVKKWVAQWQQTYFHSPWAFIAFAAAAVGLVLAATQTYYTMHPPKNNLAR